MGGIYTVIRSKTGVSTNELGDQGRKRSDDSQTIDVVHQPAEVDFMRVLATCSIFSPAVCPARAVGGVQGQAGGRARGLRAAPSIRFAQSGLK